MADTYKNAYEILEDVRYGLNEHSTAFVQATDTSGLYKNAFLQQQINDSQRRIYNRLMQLIPDEFLTSITITGVNSVYSLPWDFGTVVEFKDDQGYKVYPSTIHSLPSSGQTGYDRMYYKDGQTFVLNKSGVTDTYTLWYRTKPRDLHFGKATAGGALSMTLSTDGKSLNDYYNGMTVENRTKIWTDTIDDYVGSTRVATITETAAEDDWYGLVSELPEPFHHLIAPRASLLAKDRHPDSKEKSTAGEKAAWVEDFVEALLAFGGSYGDITSEDIFTDFGSSGAGFGVNIPGQGYNI